MSKIDSTALTSLHGDKKVYKRVRRGRVGRRRRQNGVMYAIAGTVAMFCFVLYMSGSIDGMTGDGEAVDLIHGYEDDTGRMLAGGGGGENGTCTLPMLPNALGGKTTGNVVVSGLLTLWSFIGLAIVCDEFFQPALEKISEVLELSPDVAGATFLAAGSSAPELFTSLADAFGEASSIGMGTIVGSAMFNILVIVALSAAVAGRSGASLAIDYRPVTRDVCFYSYSILLLAIFFTDGNIEMWEALIMWLSYLLYIGFMTKNEMFLAKCGGAPSDSYKISPEDEKAADAAAAALEKAADGNADSTGNGEGGGEDDKKKEEEEEEEESRFATPDTPGDWPLYILSVPFIAMFTFTIPDCASKRFENWYALSFLMSIVWIGVLCHVMVEFAVGIACIGSIDPIVMGVLVLAVGTSVPDAIGSMIAARNGEADMAIANAVGSNVFDVLLGLGFPWWLAIIVKGEDFKVCKDGIIVAVIILFCTVLLFVAVLAINKWQMNTSVGVGLFALYGLYVIYTIVSASSSGKKCG